MKKEMAMVDDEIQYDGHSLVDLAKKYGTPLRVSFLNVIKNHVLDLKKAFDEVIKANNYDGKFIYVNANKANYEFKEVKTAYDFGDGIETSSYYDLLLSSEVADKVRPIVCNGIKGDDYLDKIVSLTKNGYNVIDILDSKEEYIKLKQKVEDTNFIINVGCRIHISALYSEENDPITDDRFGMMDDEFDYIINDVKNSKNFILSTIHFHQRGFDFDKEKFFENFEKVFAYYIKAAKLLDTVCNFDMGGGTPLPVNYTFDYKMWADLIIKELQKLAKLNNIKEPNLISENGKYSQKDSTINIYKVVSIKNTCNYPWYVLDGSLLIAMPEMYALGEEILVLPINNLKHPTIEGRLSSITCDCDDVLYDKQKGYFDLPKFDFGKEDQYVAVFGTGSYQNSMSGKGGWHHCLLPEEADVVIDLDGKEIVRHKLQTIEDVKKLISFEK